MVALRRLLILTQILIGLCVIPYMYYGSVVQVEQHRAATVGMNEYQEKTFCEPGKPCVYPELVDFRLIVITFNRAESLEKLLKTIAKIHLEDDETASLEIFIDRDQRGRVDNKTVEVARRFRWRTGLTRVHIQRKHVGIYGQWIDTWNPPVDQRSKELALILEDDLSVSPYVCRWIKAVHKHYGHRSDFAGVSLTSDEVISHDGKNTKLKAPEDCTVFMYKCFGTWGFSPSLRRWREFQAWFHEVHPNPDFHPYVPGIVVTKWYKMFEELGKADSMWSMWFIYFTEQNKLFTVYNNLRTYNGDKKSCLSVNRREVGLHVKKKGKEDVCTLLDRWEEGFVKFPEFTWRLDWTGARIEEY